MSDKFVWEYQVVPNGFVYLWKAAGWRESVGCNDPSATIMKRDVKDDAGVHRGTNDGNSGLQPDSIRGSRRQAAS